ncbi:MAG: DUF5723 family protein [Bacteroidales bacterium]|jgi:hypothetical protein|nr:DUF5723 family protein [Bacteroidales bacterium]
MKQFIFTTAILLSFSIGLYSQNSNTLFLMNKSVESNIVNPAIGLHCKYYVGFPALTSLHFSVGSTGMSYRTVVDKSGEIRFSNALKRAHYVDYINLNQHIGLLSFGYKLNEDTDLFFTVTEKAYQRIGYPKDALRLVIEGNYKSLGETMKLRNTSVRAAFYREYALGMSKQVDDRLRLGGRVKLLFGRVGIKSKVKELDLTTDENTFKVTMKSDLQLLASAPMTATFDNDGYLNDITFDNDPMKYIINRKNPGIGIDLGGTYDLNDKITLSASVIDFGVIRWNSSSYRFNQSADLSFVGATDTDNASSGVNGLGVIDSIGNAMKLSNGQGGFTTWLPAQTYVAAEYRYNDQISFSFLNRNEFLYNTVIPSFTLGALYSPSYKFSTILSWSYMHNTPMNVGVGITAQLWILRMHLITDNILVAFYPEYSRTATIRFGMNFMFGCPRKGEVKHRVSRSSCPAYRYYQE